MKSLSIKEVCKRYGASHALRDVSVEVEQGELLVLLGPSGSGKTTLLRCIAGLIEPTSGRIAQGDTVFWDSAAGRSLPTNKRDLGMVFQSFALWPHMSVGNNVGYPLKARGWPKDKIRSRTIEILRLVRCEQYADRLPATLSGGQQQRIALARALAANPAIILFDEPLSNLDALLRVELRTQVRIIHSETKFTGVYVTHDQVEAMSLGDRVAVMNDGRIEQIGTPEEIYSRPRTNFVAQFMGMSNVLRVSRSGQYLNSCAGQLDINAVSLPQSESRIVRFRPENVILQPGCQLTNDQASDSLILRNAVVVDRSFQGETFQYLVKVGDTMLVAAVNAGQAFQIGDTAAVSVRKSDIGIFNVETNNE